MRRKKLPPTFCTSPRNDEEEGSRERKQTATRNTNACDGEERREDNRGAAQKGVGVKRKKAEKRTRRQKKKKGEKGREERRKKERGLTPMKGRRTGPGNSMRGCFEEEKEKQEKEKERKEGEKKRWRKRGERKRRGGGERPRFSPTNRTEKRQEESSKEIQKRERKKIKRD